MPVSENVDPFLTIYVVSLTASGMVVALAVRRLRPEGVRKLLKEAGVAVKKVARTATEIERKLFHLCGLLVPTIYQLLLQLDFSKRDCARICWGITIAGTCADMLRLRVPIVRRNWPLNAILREKEQHQLCGAVYFSMGCTIAIHFFAPAIAMTSIIFLVLGDMSAALIGISFGHDMCVVKLGRAGKKSLEGSVAMFCVCFIVGCTVFSQVRLCEYAVFIGALVATMTELYEPFGVNDNLTIPVLSSLALTFGFERLRPCNAEVSPLIWFNSR